MDIKTPALVLDRGIMEANIARMNAKMAALGVSHRPHVKTAKCPLIARESFGGDAGPITVSTLAEARAFYDDGFRDILYAVGIVPGKLMEVAELLEGGADLKIILDDPMAAKMVADWAEKHQTKLPVLIEINSDDHRAGLDPDEPALGETGKILHTAEYIDFRGIMTHAGASYDCRSDAEQLAMAEQERTKMVEATNTLLAAGVPSPMVSVGSTPTALYAQSAEGITEVRAGVYVFFDLYQEGLGTCSLDDIALSVLCTVIGHKPKFNRLLTDGGGLALSKDRGTSALPLDRGYGLVCDARTMQVQDGLIVDDVNQEHGMITTVDGSPVDFAKYPIGTRLRILPNHACMTAAAHPHYNVVDSGSDNIIEQWDMVKGW